MEWTVAELPASFLVECLKRLPGKMLAILFMNARSKDLNTSHKGHASQPFCYGKISSMQLLVGTHHIQILTLSHQNPPRKAQICLSHTSREDSGSGDGLQVSQPSAVIYLPGHGFNTMPTRGFGSNLMSIKRKLILSPKWLTAFKPFF